MFGLPYVLRLTFYVLFSDVWRFAVYIAHEIGHAYLRGPSDTSSLKNFIQAGLDREGIAVMNELRVRREILANGGRDIHGPAGPREYENVRQLDRIYDAYRAAGGTVEAYGKAIRAMGQILGNRRPHIFITENGITKFKFKT